MHYERLAEAIFFPRRNLPEDLKDVPTQEKIMEQIRSDTYTYSQFVKMFRKVIGMTPQEYRRERTNADLEGGSVNAE